MDIIHVESMLIFTRYSGICWQCASKQPSNQPSKQPKKKPPTTTHIAIIENRVELAFKKREWSNRRFVHNDSQRRSRFLEYPLIHFILQSLMCIVHPHLRLLWTIAWKPDEKAQNWNPSGFYQHQRLSFWCLVVCLDGRSVACFVASAVACLVGEARLLAINRAMTPKK